jgi:DNA-binding MarR family transcriptional regulator
MYRLSSSFPYLLARLGIRMGDLFVQVIKRDGLSLQMFRVLAALTEEDRPLKLGELAALTSADLSTLSRVIGEMHRRGIVLRERPEDDQRSLRVTLTEQGKALAARYMPVAAHYEDVATSSMTASQIKVLKVTLMRLYDNLDQLDAEIASGEIDALIPSANPGTRQRKASAKRQPRRKAVA